MHSDSLLVNLYTGSKYSLKYRVRKRLHQLLVVLRYQVGTVPTTHDLCVIKIHRSVIFYLFCLKNYFPIRN